MESKIDLKSAFLGYEDGDLPLLEELGINFTIIKRQINEIYFGKGVGENYIRNSQKEESYSPFSDRNSQKEESSSPFSDRNSYSRSFSDLSIADPKEYDLTGPLVFIILLSLGLLLNGKVLFGCIYFLCIINSIISHFFISCLSNYKISFLYVCSVLGYSLLPIVGFVFFNSLVCKVTKITNGIDLLLGILCACLSAWVSNRVFKIKYVSYTLWLLYMAFVLIAIY